VRGKGCEWVGVGEGVRGGGGSNRKWRRESVGRGCSRGRRRRWETNGESGRG